MVLSCQNISKSFGTDEVLREVSFHIEANEKAAIVGINGAGKSTLLKIIMQEEQADSGQVVVAKDTTVGYLAQYQDISGERTIYEEVLNAGKRLLVMEERLRGMEEEMNHLTGDGLEGLLESYQRLSHEFELAGGYTFRSEAAGILRGLGFPEEEFEKIFKPLFGAFFSSPWAFEQQVKLLEIDGVIIPDSLKENLRRWKMYEQDIADNIVDVLDEPEEHMSRIVQTMYYLDEYATDSKVVLFTNYKETFELYEEMLADFYTENGFSCFRRGMSADELEFVNSKMIEIVQSCFVMSLVEKVEISSVRTMWFILICRGMQMQLNRELVDWIVWEEKVEDLSCQWFRMRKKH